MKIINQERKISVGALMDHILHHFEMVNACSLIYVLSYNTYRVEKYVDVIVQYGDLDEIEQRINWTVKLYHSQGGGNYSPGNFEYLEAFSNVILSVYGIYMWPFVAIPLLVILFNMHMSYFGFVSRRMILKLQSV